MMRAPTFLSFFITLISPIFAYANNLGEVSAAVVNISVTIPYSTRDFIKIDSHSNGKVSARTEALENYRIDVRKKSGNTNSRYFIKGLNNQQKITFPENSTIIFSPE